MSSKPLCENQYCNLSASYGEVSATHCKRHADNFWIDNPDKHYFPQNKRASKKVKTIDVLMEEKKTNNELIGFRNDIFDDKYYFLSTFHEREFSYNLRLNNEGKTHELIFKSIEQGIAYLSYATQKIENEIHGRAIQDVLKKILSSKDAIAVTSLVKSLRPDRFGKQKGPSIRNYWNHQTSENFFPISYLFMFELYLSKFESNQDLKDLFLKTGDIPIKEIGSDKYMGVGPNGDGKNLLGNLLMCVRKQLSII